MKDSFEKRRAKVVLVWLIGFINGGITSGKGWFFYGNRCGMVLSHRGKKLVTFYELCRVSL